MRRWLAFALLLSIPVLLLAVAWQAGRFDALASEARRLESSQEAWLQENLGLEKAGPERRIRVTLPGKAKGGIDG